MVYNCAPFRQGSLQVRRRLGIGLAWLTVALSGVVALPAAWASSDGEAVQFEPDQAGMQIISGVVVRIAAPEHFIDKGELDGVQVGSAVRLYRTIKVKHPVTGREVVDRFVAGTCAVGAVAPHMAIVRPSNDVALLLQLGDRAEILVTATAKPRSGKADAAQKSEVGAAEPAKAQETRGSAKCATGDQKCPACAPCPACPPPSSLGPAGSAQQCEELPKDIAAAYSSFFYSLGKQPNERVDIWRNFLQRFPGSSVAPAVEREIAAMVQWMRKTEVADTVAEGREVALAQAKLLSHRTPELVRRGETLWLVFSAPDWSSITDIRVHWRRAGEPRYQLSRPEPAGPQHQRLRIPSAAVVPGAIEFFVLASHTSGTEVAVVGSASAPVSVPVAPSLGEEGLGPRPTSALRLSAEHVDFNRYRGDDAVVEAHADVTYHLANPDYLYAFTMGYGAYAGQGGRVAESAMVSPVTGLAYQKDDTIDSRKSAFKFAYIGGECPLAESFFAVTRLIVGLDDVGLNYGLEVSGRVGKDTGTNLLFGISTLGDMGRAGQIALTGRIDPTLAMTGLLEVTNRPVREDLAVRLVYEVAYRATDAIELTARLGYNLRTMVHGGMSAGGGLILHW